MVAPVCVEDTEFGLIGIAALLGEISYNLGEVVRIHREAHFLAE